MLDRFLLSLVVTAAMQCSVAPAHADIAQYASRELLQQRFSILADHTKKGEWSSVAADAASLMRTLGLPFDHTPTAKIAQTPFPRNDTAVMELVDVRLLLTQLAVQAGAKDHHALRMAQGARDHKVILIRGGHISLSDLFFRTRDTAVAPFIVMTAQGIVAKRPIAIWSDAGLTVQADDTLLLDGAEGSFLANFGWLDVDGGTIRGNRVTNAAVPAFRPFVMTAGLGGLTVRGATFESLGFGDSPVFGGLSVVNAGLSRSRMASAIRDSAFRDVASVVLLGTHDSVIMGNRLERSSAVAIHVSGAVGALVGRNMVIAANGLQAIRVTAASRDVSIRDNVLAGGARMGILVDRDSAFIDVSANIVFGHSATGITVADGDCLIAKGNLVMRNGGVGITVAKAEAARIAGNGVIMNDGSGILMRDQSSTAIVDVNGNVLVANSDGFRGATAGRIMLRGNDLDGQLHQIFAGDLAPRTAEFLRHRASARSDKALTTTPAVSAFPARCATAERG